jgi:predicted transcriptional regulator
VALATSKGICVTGQEVRQRRRRLGVSQQMLATQAGIDRVTINRYEQGKQDPHRVTVTAIARALDVLEAVLVPVERTAS